VARPPNRAIPVHSASAHAPSVPLLASAL
jgi:hypothetical protein